eukprot:NODE_655_length_1424_cov_298.132944.p1 GENE.NODE_655_length_1424_cov_298.132944~~NODE_655_length_1424_cov_298.132944.p1  ORF type:complete len:314 (+),score=47.28 NODE_655_length_1424_cov_298.132944:281-1222(+)
MSYSSGNAPPNRSNIYQQAGLRASMAARAANGNQPRRSSESAASPYAWDCRKIQDAAQQIQRLAADVRKETSLLATPASGSSRQAGDRAVEELERQALTTAEEAGKILEGLPNIAPASEQAKCRLTQSKFRENIAEAMKSFEAAKLAFGTARARMPSPGSAPMVASGAGSGRTTSPNLAAFGAVEMELESRGNLGAALLPLQAQEEMLDEVTEAECDVHNDIVQGYTNDILAVEQDIRGLQRVMVDLAEHANAQGQPLASIQQHMEEAVVSSASAAQEVVQANRSQRGNAKQVACMLIAATLIVLGVLLYALN